MLSIQYKGAHNSTLFQKHVLNPVHKLHAISTTLMSNSLLSPQ